MGMRRDTRSAQPAAAMVMVVVRMEMAVGALATPVGAQGEPGGVMVRLAAERERPEAVQVSVVADWALVVALPG